MVVESIVNTYAYRLVDYPTIIAKPTIHNHFIMASMCLIMIFMFRSMVSVYVYCKTNRYTIQHYQTAENPSDTMYCSILHMFDQITTIQYFD